MPSLEYDAYANCKKDLTAECQEVATKSDSCTCVDRSFCGNQGEQEAQHATLAKLTKSLSLFHVTLFASILLYAIDILILSTVPSLQSFADRDICANQVADKHDG